MANISTTSLGLTLDTSSYTKNLKSTQRSTSVVLKSLNDQAQVFSDSWADITKNLRSAKSVASSMALYGTFTAIATGASLATIAIADFSANMENAKISMQYFIDGADKATQSLAYLREMQALAAKTSFTTESAINLSKFMASMGVDIRATKSVMTVINDAAAATGASEQRMQSIVTAMGQILTKGRLAAEEVRQLANANIPIYDILQEQLNLTGDQIKDIGNYWIDADKAVVAILTGLEKRYKGAAGDIANTMAGMVNSIKDNSLMISQIATSGIYDAAAAKVYTLRDALASYRDIAVNQGSSALFRQLLLDIDASGEVGTQILALVGNVRDLMGAFKELYISAKPLLSVGAKGLYYQVTTLTVATTAFVKVLNVGAEALDKMGISSDTAIKALSGLYITYKVARMFGTVGQAAAALTMNIYNMASSAINSIPAIAGLSTAWKLGIVGALGLGSAIFLASGALDALVNSIAGLNASGDVLPSDYEEQFAAYQQAMEEYNNAITAYSDGFDKAFTSIAENGATTFKMLQKKSETAAKKSADSWLASFDEVFKVPEDNDTGKDNKDKNAFPDLSGLLHGLTFKFPTIESKAPEMPTFNWSSVYDQNTLSTAVAGGMSAATPLLLIGLSTLFGNSFIRKVADENAAKGLNAATSLVTTGKLGKAQSELQQALSDQAKANKALQAYIQKYSKSNVDNIDAYKLEELIDQATEQNKRVAEINKKIGTASRVDTSDITKANQLLTRKQLSDLKAQYDNIQGLLLKAQAKEGTDTTVEIASLNSQLKSVQKQMQRAYNSLSDITEKGLVPDNIAKLAMGLPIYSAEQINKKITDTLFKVYASVSDMPRLSDDVEKVVRTAVRPQLDSLQSLATDLRTLEKHGVSISGSQELLDIISDMQRASSNLSALERANDLANISSRAARADDIDKARTALAAAVDKLATYRSQFDVGVYKTEDAENLTRLVRSITAELQSSQTRVYTGINEVLNTYNLHRLGAIQAAPTLTATNKPVTRLLKDINTTVGNITTQQKNYIRAELEVIAKRMDSAARRGEDTKAIQTILSTYYRKALASAGYVPNENGALADMLVERLYSVLAESRADMQGMSDVLRRIRKDTYNTIVSRMLTLKGEEVSTPVTDVFIEASEAIKNPNIEYSSSAFRQALSDALDSNRALRALPAYDNLDAFLNKAVTGIDNNVNQTISDIAKPGAITRNASPLEDFRDMFVRPDAAPFDDDLLSEVFADRFTTLFSDTSFLSAAKLTPSDVTVLNEAINDVLMAVTHAEDFSANDIVRSIEFLDAQIYAVTKDTDALHVVNNTLADSISAYQNSLKDVILSRTFTDADEATPFIRAYAGLTEARAGITRGVPSRTITLIANDIEDISADVAKLNNLDSRDIIKSVVQDMHYQFDSIEDFVNNAGMYQNKIYQLARPINFGSARVTEAFAGAVPDNLLRNIFATMRNSNIKSNDAWRVASVFSSIISENSKMTIGEFDKAVNNIESRFNRMFPDALFTKESGFERVKPLVNAYADALRNVMGAPATRLQYFTGEDARAYSFAKKIIDGITSRVANATPLNGYINAISGGGTRAVTDKALYTTLTPEVRTVRDAFISKLQSNGKDVFRPNAYLLNSGDIYTMLHGTSQYGTTIPNVLNRAVRPEFATASSKEARGAYNSAAMIRGQIVEDYSADALLSRVKQMLGNEDVQLVPRQVLYDWDKGLSAQLDFQMALDGKSLGAVELKTVGDNQFISRLTAYLDKSYDAQKGVYTMTASQLNYLRREAPSWFYQMLGQASVLNSEYATLALVDTKELTGAADAIEAAQKASAGYRWESEQEEAARQVYRMWMSHDVLRVMPQTEVDSIAADIARTINRTSTADDAFIKSTVADAIANWIAKPMDSSLEAVSNTITATIRAGYVPGRKGPRVPIAVSDEQAAKIAEIITTRVRGADNSELEKAITLVRFKVTDAADSLKEVEKASAAWRTLTKSINKRYDYTGSIVDAMRPITSNGSFLLSAPSSRVIDNAIPAFSFGGDTTNVRVFGEEDTLQNYIAKLVQDINNGTDDVARKAADRLKALPDALLQVNDTRDAAGWATVYNATSKNDYPALEIQASPTALRAQSIEAGGNDTADGIIVQLREYIRKVHSADGQRLLSMQDSFTNLQKGYEQFLEAYKVDKNLRPDNFMITAGLREVSLRDYQREVRNLLSNWENTIDANASLQLKALLDQDLASGTVRNYLEEFQDIISKAGYRYANAQETSAALEKLLIGEQNAATPATKALSEASASLDSVARSMTNEQRIVDNIQSVRNFTPQAQNAERIPQEVVTATNATADATQDAADAVHDANKLTEKVTKGIEELDAQAMQDVLNEVRKDLTSRGIKISGNDDIFSLISSNNAYTLESLRKAVGRTALSSQSSIVMPGVAARTAKSYINGFEGYRVNDTLATLLQKNFAAGDITGSLDKLLTNAIIGADDTLRNVSVITARKSAIRAARMQPLTAEAIDANIGMINQWFDNLLRRSPSLFTDSMNSVIKGYGSTFKDFNKLMKQLNKANIADDISSIRSAANTELDRLLNNAIDALTHKPSDAAVQVYETINKSIADLYAKAEKEGTAVGKVSFDDALEELRKSANLPDDLVAEVRRLNEPSKYINELARLRIEKLPESTNLAELKKAVAGIEALISKDSTLTLDNALSAYLRDAKLNESTRKAIQSGINSIASNTDELRAAAKALDNVDELSSASKLAAITDAIRVTSKPASGIAAAGRGALRGLGHAGNAAKEFLFSSAFGYSPLDVIFAGVDFAVTDSIQKGYAEQYKAGIEEGLAYGLASIGDDARADAIASMTGISDAYSKAFADMSAYASRTIVDVVAQVGGNIIGNAAAGAAGGGIGALIGAAISIVYSVSQDLMGFNTAWGVAHDELKDFIINGEAYNNLLNKGLSSEEVFKYGTVANKNAARTLTETIPEAWYANSQNVLSMVFSQTDLSTLAGLQKYFSEMSTVDLNSFVGEVAKENPTGDFKEGLQEAELRWYAQGFIETISKLSDADWVAANTQQNGVATEEYNKAQLAFEQIYTGAILDALKGNTDDFSNFTTDVLQTAAANTEITGDLAEQVRNTAYALGDTGSLQQLINKLYGVTDLASDASKAAFYTEQAAKALAEYNKLQASNTVATAAVYSLRDTSNFVDYQTSALSSLQSSAFSAEADRIKEFADAAGLSISALNDFTDELNVNVSDTLWAVKTNGDEFVKRLDGWTIDSTIDVTTLSPNEVTVLATAGIQINSDGTITFANARTEDMAGTTRGADYDAKDVSAAERATLAAAGIYLEGANGTSNNQLTLDDKLIRSAVTEAMFDMSGILGSQSAAAATVLSGLVEIVDGNGNAVDYEKISEGLGMFSEETGMFTLTNKAILSGEKTIADWFDEYEAALTENGSVISESTKEALLAIQKALTTDLNGATTNGAVTFDWAKGIGLTLEGSIDNFSEQTLATLREMGIELTDYDGQLKAVISNYSNELTNGTTVISSAEFAKLSDATKTALNDMGVKFTEVGNWVAVDVSDTIGNSLDKLRAAYMVTPDAINNTSTAFQKWLQDIGMLDAENNLLQWNPQQSTYLSVVDEDATDEYNKRFATALQYADSARATLDKAAADSDLKTEYIANNLTYIDVLSYDAWQALDKNGNGIIEASEQVANGVAISLEEADADLVRQLAAYYGYAENNIEQFKKDFAGISFKEATESQFLGVEDAYQGLFDELEAALAAGGTELEESAKQIAAAVRAALEDSFEGMHYDSVKISKAEADNRAWLESKTEGFWEPAKATDSSSKWADIKSGGYANGYIANTDNTIVYTHGKKFTVDTVNIEDALMAVGRQLYGSDYAPAESGKGKLGIKYKDIGYANGGIVEDDGLYRIAEQNRREAIIPLENPNVSAHIGAAMASMMLASEQWRRVAGLIGIQNGGMSSRITERPIVEQRSTDDMTSTIVDTVLQRVIPAMAQQGSNAGATYEDTRTPVYVGTLIADDTGIRELNKRMRIVEAQEMRRR